MTNANPAANTDATQLARHRMAAFVAAKSGATLERSALVVGDKIVVSGSHADCAKVAKWGRSIGLTVTVDPIDTEDPSWTCARISSTTLTAALR